MTRIRMLTLVGLVGAIVTFIPVVGLSAVAGLLAGLAVPIALVTVSLAGMDGAATALAVAIGSVFAFWVVAGLVIIASGLSGGVASSCACVLLVALAGAAAELLPKSVVARHSAQDR